MMALKPAALMTCTALLWGAALSAWGEDSSAQARKIMGQMSLATKTLNYDATFVYIRGNNVASMRIIHKADAGGEHERLVSLSGSAKEVIRNQQEVTCIFPSDRAVMVDKRRPPQIRAGLPQRIETISDYYTYSVLGGDRVAGRPTWVVAIQPNGDDRFGYRLWVDTSSHLLLKSEVLDVNGNVLEQVLLTAIEVPREIPDSLLQASISGQGYTWHTTKRGSRTAAYRAEADWTAHWLPVGFSMQDRTVRAMDGNAEPVSHMVFSDGLATVSIFVEKLPPDQPRKEGFSASGAVHTYSRMSDDHQITVVGEVPPATLHKIAISVSARTASP